MHRAFCVLCLLLTFLIALPFFALAAPWEDALPVAAATPPTTSARAMALLDAESGTLIASKNESARLPMASTTKIMTALVILEHLPLDRVVTVPAEAVGIEGSSIYLFAGEQITVETLLYALLLSSANDAAVTLAIETVGTVEDFAALMNEKAAELGLANTHFCNPHGLHEESHYTTAQDLARLTAAALENETFAGIVSTPKHLAAQNGTDATRLFRNHNRLLTGYEGAIGVKTGYTKKAGRCLVSAAARDGLTLVCVTLDCPDDWKDHAALLDWGFSEYVHFSASPEPLSLPVVGGEHGEVTLLPLGTLSLTLPRVQDKIECTAELPRFLFAGFEQGKKVGELVYRQNGIEIARIPLLTATACATERPPTLWARLKRIFQK